MNKTLTEASAHAAALISAGTGCQSQISVLCPTTLHGAARDQFNASQQGRLLGAKNVDERKARITALSEARLGAPLPCLWDCSVDAKNCAELIRQHLALARVIRPELFKTIVDTRLPPEIDSQWPSASSVAFIDALGS